MSERVRNRIQLDLEYHHGVDVPGKVYVNAPVEPQHTDELTLAVRSDNEEDLEQDPRAPAILGRPQIHLAGSPRALEEFGRYLIALARLESADPDPHEHFEDVQNADGGTVHLIVHRSGLRGE